MDKIKNYGLKYLTGFDNIINDPLPTTHNSALLSPVRVSPNHAGFNTDFRAFRFPLNCLGFPPNDPNPPFVIPCRTDLIKFWYRTSELLSCSRLSAALLKALIKIVRHHF